MKLYTEQQVMRAIELAKYCEYDCGGVYFDFNLDSILPKLTPIELPSDEEIREQAKGHSTFAPSFIYGAQWMRDKIQGDSK
jgi:hypothetical protein